MLTRAGAAQRAALAGHDGRQPPVLRLDAVTQLPQRVDQRALRPLVHARRALHSIDTAAQAQHRQQEARHRSGVTNVYLQRRALASLRWVCGRLGRCTVDRCGCRPPPRPLRPRPRIPDTLSASTMISVSSLHSAPRSVVVPSPSAASTSARFVRLFEPGTVTSTGAAAAAPRSRRGQAVSCLGGSSKSVPNRHLP